MTISSETITAAKIAESTVTTADLCPSPRRYLLVVPGDPVPWQAAVKMGNAPNAPRKMPGRQEHHAGKIRTAWVALKTGLWLEKGQAVHLDCTFLMTRPKAHYGTGRNARQLKPQFIGRHPTGRPDLSNCLKMVEDALTGSAWADDDQVVELRGRKRYIDWWEQPRTVVRLTPR